MLLKVIKQQLDNAAKTRSGLQVHYAEVSQELVIIEANYLPFGVRIVGDAIQIIIFEEYHVEETASGTFKNNGCTVLLKSQAQYFENMEELLSFVQKNLDVIRFRHKELEMEAATSGPCKNHPG